MTTPRGPVTARVGKTSRRLCAVAPHLTKNERKTPRARVQQGDEKWPPTERGVPEERTQAREKGAEQRNEGDASVRVPFPTEGKTRNSADVSNGDEAGNQCQ